MRKLLSAEETAARIAAGDALLLAGDEALLRQMPRGDWIGGTIPYFVSDEGGVTTKEKLFASALPPAVVSFSTRFYSEAELPALIADEPRHGFSFIILPAFAAVHKAFAKNVPGYRGVYERPLMGWVAGVELDEVDTRRPKVVDGRTGTWSECDALCLHAHLIDDVAAEIGIINPFTQGAGDVITVERPSFHAGIARINGEPMNLAQYFTSRNVDPRLPLVADYSGAMVNVSIKSVNVREGRVDFYAPLFPDVEYRLAVPVADYEEAFAREIAKISALPMLSVNCVLNYSYGKLKGPLAGDFTGPITFGEIAYGLLNQTLVYMVLRNT
jgi:hypothetical protein